MKSGFKSSAGYDGAGTVVINVQKCDLLAKKVTHQQNYDSKQTWIILEQKDNNNSETISANCAVGHSLKKGRVHMLYSYVNMDCKDSRLWKEVQTYFCPLNN